MQTLIEPALGKSGVQKKEKTHKLEEKRPRRQGLISLTLQHRSPFHRQCPPRNMDEMASDEIYIQSARRKRT